MTLLLLDLKEEIAFNRVKSRGEGDHYDQGDISFYKTLRDSFVDLASKNQNRIKIINAEQDIAAISNDIQQTVLRELSDAV